MKALTLWEPWAWAVAHAGKWIENRTWRPPHFIIGERIAIHAGKTFDREAMEELADEFGIAPEGWESRYNDDPDRVGKLAPGCIVATARVAGWVNDDVPSGHVELPPGHPSNHNDMIRDALKSPWYAGDRCYGWVLLDMIALKTSIPCRGAQGLWDVPAEIVEEIKRQERQ